MSLDGNMRLGVDAAGYTRQKVPKSANYKFTSSALMLNNKPLKMHTASDAQLNSLRSQYGQPGADPGAFWTWLVKVVGKVEKAGIGNCGEVAAVALAYLKAKGVTETLDYVNVLDGQSMNAVVPHVIAVIGRGGDAQQDIGLPSTWSADAVICDPWDRVVYPAKDYDFFWRGLKTHSSSPSTLTCELVVRAP